MSESRDYLEMTFQSINCFANDGKLDATEFGKIVGIALKDGVVDENEKRVLANIIDRLSEDELQGELGVKVGQIKDKYF